MRILQLIHELNVVQLDIQELVDGLEGAFDRNVVLELDGHFVIDESLEEAAEQQPVSLTQTIIAAKRAKM